jgi:hypothetical protein
LCTSRQSLFLSLLSPVGIFEEEQAISNFLIREDTDKYAGVVRGPSAIWSSLDFSETREGVRIRPKNDKGTTNPVGNKCVPSHALSIDDLQKFKYEHFLHHTSASGWKTRK